MSEIANSLRGLPLEELIGGPLAASCKAQYDLASCMVNFIHEIGFSKDGDASKTKCLEFDLERPVDDGTGEIKSQTVSIKAPLLGLVPIPALLIESVNIDFSMEVNASTSSKSTNSASAELEAKANWGWGSAKFTGKVSSQRENTRSTDNTAKYDIKVVAKQQPPQEGMSKLMDLLASAVEPIAIKRASGD
ncbi:DUF2589 domain-containing protein [Kistimonas asteriae]|uniref:DUF2589 domain-containing protein n=1 Tax=Kistimonas asteriae TaxID=517724 RepID=UPI001BA75685|nr:DUF2589 domain-containing protein [Kistimonas asteriae]